MRFCLRISGPIFGVKLNLHICKTVKDFKTLFLNDISVANVCTMKKTRGLYRVSERRYFNFSPGHFSDNCGYTYRAGCTVMDHILIIIFYLSHLSPSYNFTWVPGENRRLLICLFYLHENPCLLSYQSVFVLLKTQHPYF
jgi:hypothetical protein